MSFERGEAWVKYDDREVTVARLREVINDTGFKAVEEGGKQGSSLPPHKMGGDNQATSRGYSKDPACHLGTLPTASQAPRCCRIYGI